MMSSVVLKNIHKSFDKVETIHNINLSIEEGEFVVFVGPSGCGKSTLLRLIAGLEDITSGALYIDNELVNDLPPAKRGVSMVFQSYALYPHMTVYDNMAFGLKLAKTAQETVDARVREVAKILELEPLLDRLPRQLSGGQRQRVAIGRALVRKPKVFLLDEPLSNLDAALRVQTRLELAKLHKSMNSTTIYVTHDQVEAMTLADRIVVLRNGYLEQVGEPLTLYHHPANQFVAGFIGSPKMNFLPVKAERISEQVLRVHFSDEYQLDLPFLRGTNARFATTLGIRPEHIRLTTINNAVLNGEIEIIEKLGESQFAYIRIPGEHLLVARLRGKESYEVGERVGVLFSPNETHLFNENGVSITRRYGAVGEEFES